MMTLLGRFLFAAAVVACGTVSGRAADLPEFKEVFEVVRTNAAGVTETELNRAAVEGLLARLGGRAWIVNPAATTNAVSETNQPQFTSSALFDENYGYIRIARVDAGLPQEFANALSRLTSTNKLKGLVLDLRFAAGSDYAAAVKVADRFFTSERPLLDWGTGLVSSTDKTDAFRQPLAVLVNSQTRSAAEALAAVLREHDLGLLIGTNTAGQASLTKDFKLSTGQTLRLATAFIKVGDGDVVEQLKPDIRIDVSPEDERAYFVDAFKVLPRAGVTASRTNVASLSVTNRPRRRLNEAELVRMLREGDTQEEEAPASREPAKPVITDPALARAIDLLKALAVVRGTRS
jgi:hypothetical protein